MNKYNELITLRDTFLDMLSIAVNNATTQEQFEELESITEEIFNRIPREIASCDYIMRGVIQSYLDDNDKKDMNKVNRFMEQICNDNVFHLNDDYLCDDLQYAADKFYGKTKDDDDE